MAEGRQRDQWDHTSAMLAVTVNIHRGKGKARQPSDFHPFTKRDRRNRPKPIQAPISVLVDTFCGKQRAT